MTIEHRTFGRPTRCVASVVAVLLAVSTAGCREQGSKEPQERASENEANERPIRVATAQVTASDFRETVDGIGSIESPKTVTIRPEVAAVVEKVHFDEGRPVKQGDRLFTLDDAKLQDQLQEVQQQIDAAQAEYKVAQRNFQRIDQLREDGVTTQERFDAAWRGRATAREAIDRLKARRELIRERLADTEIAAPMNAVAAERLVDPGDFVSVGDPIVRLYQQSPMEVAFTLPEHSTARVELGMEAAAQVDAYPDRSFPGKISYVGPQIDPVTRKLPVKASVENPQGRLTPGMFAAVRVTLDVRKQRPTVPEEALAPRRDGYAVFVVRDGKARFQPVEVGLRRGTKVEIAKGLEVGQTIVRAGHQKLSDGSPVTEADDSSADTQADDSSSDKVHPDGP